MPEIGRTVAGADTRTSTLVVAASNSLDPTLAPAAYRCDGTEDNVEMNAALTAAAAVNGRVELLEGAYNTVLALSVAVNVALFGNGHGSVINFNAGGNAITVAGDNVKLRDFKVVITAGAGAGGSRPNCIYANGRTNVETTGLWLVGDETVGDDGVDLRQCGIVFSTVSFSRIAFCKIDDQKRHGFILNGVGDSTVTGNTCQGNTQRGIRLTSSNRNTLTGNTVKSNVVYGIYLDASDDNVIAGNSCNWNTQAGIGLYDSMDNTVTGNTCQGNTVKGIYLITSNDNTITGNTCQGSVEGIYLFNNSLYNTITGNTCQGNTEYGITLESAAHSNTVTGNTCRLCTSGGINVYNSNNNTVTGNTCNENVGHGIRVELAVNNTIVGNTCNGNDRNNTGVFDGICIQEDSDYNLVMSNTCDDNDRWGISIGIVADDCVGNWIKNNTLRGNTSGPFFDGGTDTKLAVKVFQFTEPVGTAAWQVTSPTGILVNAAAEGALALGEAPLEVQMAVRFRVKAVALGATGAGKGMLLEININAGKPTGSEPYNAEAIAVASVISTEDDVAANDAIEWIIDATDDVDVDDIEFGETIEMFALFEDTGADGDIATNAVLRTISMEFV